MLTMGVGPTECSCGGVVYVVGVAGFYFDFSSTLKICLMYTLYLDKESSSHIQSLPPILAACLTHPIVRCSI